MNAMRCKHCGWQETDHEVLGPDSAEEYDQKLPGRRVTLVDCPGFELTVRDERINRRIERKLAVERTQAGKTWESRAEIYDMFLAGELPGLRPF